MPKPPPLPTDLLGRVIPLENDDDTGLMITYDAEAAVLWAMHGGGRAY